jgi:hypothetical protein
MLSLERRGLGADQGTVAVYIAELVVNCHNGVLLMS